MGGRITKRVWTPPTGGNYAPFIRQLPPPDKVDGYFWLVGGANTGTVSPCVRAGVRASGTEPESGNLFLYFLGNYGTVASRLVGSYFGGFGTFQTGGLKKAQAAKYVTQASKWFPGVADVNDGFFYNYWNAAWALVQGLNESDGAVGRRLQSVLPRSLKPGFQVPTTAS